jgi:hypothetical protein
MPFVPFHDKFPELGHQEMRSLTLLQDTDVPAGQYGLMEMYCDEPACDCRRVLFSVLSVEKVQIVAVISYGWESPQFYTNWMGTDDPEVIRELKGPSLTISSPQSPLAPAILSLVETLILQDQRYIERLKTHYALFREAVDKEASTRHVRKQRKSRARRHRRRS